MLAALLCLAVLWVLVVLGAVALCVAARRSDAAAALQRRAPNARTRRFAPVP